MTMIINYEHIFHVGMGNLNLKKNTYVVGGFVPMPQTRSFKTIYHIISYHAIQIAAIFNIRQKYSQEKTNGIRVR